MTVMEILEQVKALSRAERDELLAELRALNEDTSVRIPKSQTGAEIVAILNAMQPIEFVDPDIEDPVEWVKQLRHDQRKKRLGDWGDSG